MGAAEERVLAQRATDQHWYPATVRETDEQRRYVDFDDGASGWVAKNQVVPLMLTIGNRVEANWQDDGTFYPGVISKQDGDRVHIRYDDGGQEWTDLAHVRVPPGDTAVAAAAWAEGDRVLAVWEDDDCWYPGTVKPGRLGSISIHFDNGSAALVQPNQVRRLALGVGSRVEGRWQGGGKFHEGEITAREGERVHIRYADGDQEWTTMAMLRQRPDQAGVQVVGAGSRVLARWQGGEAFYLARVTRREGDRVHVHYDDDCEEWTTLDQVVPAPETLR
jgi:hypothetical protein